MTGYGATITAGAAPDYGSWVREGQNWKFRTGNIRQQMEALQRAGFIRRPAGII